MEPDINTLFQQKNCKAWFVITVLILHFVPFSFCYFWQPVNIIHLKMCSFFSIMNYN